MGVRRVVPKNAVGEAITGEQGSVWFLDRPIELTRTDVLKVFHSNWGISTSGDEANGYYVRQDPRFIFSQTRAGFFRLYHIHQLSHALFPENVIDLRGVLVPDRWGSRREPFYFDEYSPPRMKDGSVQFPQFTSVRVPVVPEQEARIRRSYKIIDANRTHFARQFHELYSRRVSSGGYMMPDEYHELDLGFRGVVDTLNKYEGWLEKFARRRGLSLAATELKFFEAGITLPHASVNALVTPPSGGSSGRIVFCEVSDYIDARMVRRAIRSLDDKDMARAARHHLKMVRTYEDEARGELIASVEESEKTEHRLRLAKSFLAQRTIILQSQVRGSGSSR